MGLVSMASRKKAGKASTVTGVCQRDRTHLRRRCTRASEGRQQSALRLRPVIGAHPRIEERVAVFQRKSAVAIAVLGLHDLGVMERRVHGSNTFESTSGACLSLPR